MNSSIRINSIINQISSLDYNSKIQVVEKILTMIKSKEKKHVAKIKLTDLKGLGSDIWNNINIDEYIAGERQWD